MELNRIGAQFRVDIVERTLPTEEEVSRVVAQRTTALLEARLREADSLKRERLQRFLPLVKSLSEEGEEAELIALLVDDYYQKELHKPTPPAQPEPASRAQGRRPDRDSGRRGEGRGERDRGGGDGGRPRRRRRRN